MTKIIRVRALDAPDSSCTGCVGCMRAPEGEYCADESDNIRRDFIFIRDTPEGRAEYAALVLEHGLRPDQKFT